MKFTSALGLFLSVSGLVRAEKSDECKELKSYLDNKVQINGFECESNDEGKITKLDIEDFIMKEEDFMKIQSYDTITDFSYRYYDSYGDPYRHKPEYNFFTNLKNLKNLQKLSITYDVYKNPCTSLCHVHYLSTIGKNTFKDLKNLKELSIFGIKLSQDNIDEISTLENMESLALNYCSFEDVKDYSSLSNLKKVKYLYSSQNSNGYYNSDSTIVPSEFVGSFKNLIELQVDNCPYIDYKQLTNIATLKIDDEDDTSFLKNFKNLETLEIKPYNDLSILEHVDSLKNLIIYYDPASHGYASFPYQDMNLKLSENSNINYLELHGVKITNENMNEILKLKKLNNVRFEYCNFMVSDEYIDILKNFQNLCPFEVYYSSCYVNDEFVGGITNRIKNENCSNIIPITTLRKLVPTPAPVPPEISDPEPEPTEYSDPEEPSEYSDPEEPFEYSVTEEAEIISDPEDPEPTPEQTEYSDPEEPVKLVPSPAPLLSEISDPEDPVSEISDYEDLEPTKNTQKKINKRNYIKNNY